MREAAFQLDAGKTRAAEIEEMLTAPQREVTRMWKIVKESSNEKGSSEMRLSQRKHQLQAC